MATEVQWIWFDLGGVLVDIHMEAALAHWTQAYGHSPEFWTSSLFDSGLKESMDKGILSTDEVVATLRLTCPEMDRAGFEAGWRKVLTPRPSMTLLLGQLAQRYPLALLSNTDPVHYQWALDTIPELASLHHHFVSFHARCWKPERAFYTWALEQVPCSPEQVFFVDDLAKNVEGAQLAGIDAVQFTTEERFRQTLLQRGLVP